MNGARPCRAMDLCCGDPDPPAGHHHGWYRDFLSPCWKAATTPGSPNWSRWARSLWAWPSCSAAHRVRRLRRRLHELHHAGRHASTPVLFTWPSCCSWPEGRWPLGPDRHLLLALGTSWDRLPARPEQYEPNRCRTEERPQVYAARSSEQDSIDLPPSGPGRFQDDAVRIDETYSQSARSDGRSLHAVLFQSGARPRRIGIREGNAMCWGWDEPTCRNSSRARGSAQRGPQRNAAPGRRVRNGADEAVPVRSRLAGGPPTCMPSTLP